MGSFDKSPVKIRLRSEKHGTLGWGCWVDENGNLDSTDSQECY